MTNNETRKLILARRARFLAAALAGTAITTGACDGEVQTPPDQTTTSSTEPQTCLTSGGGFGGTPEPCLGVPAGGGGFGGTPEPCLSPPGGWGGEGGSGAGGAGGAGGSGGAGGG